MKPFVKYIKQLDADKEILNTYRELRYLFQEYGWSEEQLESPPYYTDKLMRLYEIFTIQKNELFFELNLYFTNVGRQEFNEFIINKMKQINDEIPLNKKED